MKINFTEYLNLLNEDMQRLYIIKSGICYFPLINSEINLKDISIELNKCGKFLNHTESFIERKDICEKDIEWKDFINNLKKDCNYICQESHYSSYKFKQLSKEIFDVQLNQSWINNYLTPHHIDGTIEYKCFDKTKLRILNRAIHMTQHRLDFLQQYIPRICFDYDLQFELGCLIHDRNNKYPWENIIDNMENK